MALDRKLYTYFFLAALALHLSFMAVRFNEKFEVKLVDRSDAIKVDLMQNADVIKALASIKTKQIVQSEDSVSKEKPTKEAFLSDKDRSFDRETIAKNVNTFQKAGAGNAAVNSKPSLDKTAKADRVEKKAKKDLKLSDFGFQAAELEASRAPASELVQGLENGDLNSSGLSATNDYVEEVSLGDFTRLNTVEFKHYGFFHRIRQKLEQFWGKTLHEKADNIFRSGRRLPASDNLITSLRVSLNAKGEIVGVKILGTSGVRELDDAAIESFNQAGPFPNPPKDLLVNGEATIEWGFVVKS